MENTDFRQAAALLQSAGEKTVTVGFDGYVDSIIKVKYQNCDGEAEYFDTMKQFGDYIVQKAQRSCSLELKVVREKIGGNMPIYAKALGRLGMRLNCIGAMGWPEALPLFREGMGEKCRLLSVSQPGSCQALEFKDGKVMLARNEEIEQLDYSVLLQRAGEETLRQSLTEADAVTFLNWSELKGATSIWRGIAAEILPGLPKREKRPMFIDLSDCSSHKEKSVSEMAELLTKFTEYFEVIVSLNRNETEQLADKLGVGGETLSDRARNLKTRFGCEILIVHLPNGCIAFSNQEEISLKNLLISEPRLLTGGGDNFNAGFTFAYLNGLGMREALCTANAVSGYYVANGHSPTRLQLLSWIKQHQYFEPISLTQEELL